MCYNIHINITHSTTGYKKVLLYIAVILPVFYTITLGVLHASILPFTPAPAATNLVGDFSSTKNNGQVELYSMYTLHIPQLQLTNEVVVPPISLWNTKQWPLLETAMKIGMETSGVVAYPHSVVPGERGTIFLTGHSSPPNSSVPLTKETTIFKRLPDLVQGSTIYLLEGTTTYEYQVEGFQIVSPEKIDVIRQQFSEPRLFIITCYPIGTTTERYVLSAKLVAVY